MASIPPYEYPADEAKAQRIRDIEKRIEERPFQAPIIPTLIEAARIIIEGGNEPEPSPVERKPIRTVAPKEQPPEYGTYVPRPTRPFIESKERIRETHSKVVPVDTQNLTHSVDVGNDPHSRTGDNPSQRPTGTEVVRGDPERVSEQPKIEPEKSSHPAPKKSAESVPETIPNNSQTIPNHARNEPEWKNAPEPENALNMPEIEDEGEVGRKRKYEDTGIYGDISVKDIVLFRHIKKRHWPDLSGDMKAWYEHFYFKRPAKREKPYRGRDYEQHKRAYERGQEWIAEYNASTARDEAMGSSGHTVIPFPQRASS